MTAAEKIKEMGIVPVVVLEDEKDAGALAKALCEGGLPCAEVTFRTAAAKVLPEEIAFRKKLGFIVPIRIWMADDRYNADVRRLFASDIAEKFFHVEEIRAIFDEYVGGNSDNWRKVWTIYTFLVWYEEYFVKR